MNAKTSTTILPRFSSRIPCVSARVTAASGRVSRHELLRAYSRVSREWEDGGREDCFELELGPPEEPRARPLRPTRHTVPPHGSTPRVLLFENLFVDPDRPARDQPRCMAGGTFQLASALRAHGMEPVIVTGHLCGSRGLDDPRQLDRALESGVDLVAITLLEACFAPTTRLVERIRRRSEASIAVGGAMATLAPIHVAAHMDVDLVVRGPGEDLLPLLARILTGGLDENGQQTLLCMNGILMLTGDGLLAAHPGIVQETDPDATPMDFSLLGPEHLEGGLSLETSRGCTNPCLFCTTPGRDRHRGSSAQAVSRRIRDYEHRLQELFGRGVPRPARRLQICDDDFTCDAGRAAAVLDAIGETSLKLSAFQASVRDFFDRHGPHHVLDERLLDAIRPSLFQDESRWASVAAGPPVGRIPDDAGPFVHLGVEALNDGDLKLLGKGYRTHHVAELVQALDHRGIVHDAYLILAGPSSTLENLAETLLTASRLKIEHPHTFFIRIPVVDFVVPTFPSASYELWSRRIASGEITGEIEVERTLHVEGYDEFDYPLVARSVPGDGDLREACEQWEAIIDPDPVYRRPAENLESWLRARLPAVEDRTRASRIRAVIRKLAGAHRRIVYQGLARARRAQLPDTVGQRYWDAASRLGPADQVAQEARNAIQVGDPRLVVIPTRDCSLRCTYCPMVKQPGLTMTDEILDEAIALLMSSSSPDVILQFFGGEALLRRNFVERGMERAMEAARRAGKHVGFILSTNGLSLDEQLIDRISALPVKVELSIDGTADVHNRHRRARDRDVDSHAMATRCARHLIDSGIPHEVIMVVTPQTVDRLSESFSFVASLGFPRIQVNNALAVHWSREKMEAFARQLHAIEMDHYRDEPAQRGAELIDLKTFIRPMLLNGEITVDHDGTVFYGNGFLVRMADPRRFRAGHLDDLENMDTYLFSRPDNDYLIRHTYPPDVARNNIQVGRIYASFVRHMRERFPDLRRTTGVQAPAGGCTR